MPDPIITLTTDFGLDSPYVAAMKGVMVGINPAARIVDLSHEIAPQDLRHAAFFLKNAVPFFPRDVVHVIVVDPGVGTERALLFVKGSGHVLLAPDNGCWTPLIDNGARDLVVVKLEDARFWRAPLSATFHGRDILAPVAAHLSLGLDYRQLGPPADRWVRLPWPAPECTATSWSGEIVFVDHFGNLITNIPGAAIPLGNHTRFRVLVGGKEIRPAWVKSYARASEGTLVALIGSSGDLELAVTNGNAVRELGAGVGTRVEVRG